MRNQFGLESPVDMDMCWEMKGEIDFEEAVKIYRLTYMRSHTFSTNKRTVRITEYFPDQKSLDERLTYLNSANNPDEISEIKTREYLLNLV